MKKEHQEYQDSECKKNDLEEKNKSGNNADRKDDAEQSDQEKNEDIDYSKFDIDESTGGSAMAEEVEAEEDDEEDEDGDEEE